MTQMPYPRLFLRMAMHIGFALGAFVLIGAASLGLIAASELRGYIETRNSTLGEQAASVLAAGGESALIDWISNEATIPEDVNVYILDEYSNDILGRNVPSQYAEFIRNSVVGLPAKPDSNFRPVRLAPQLIGPDGRLYSLLVLPRGISLWGSPATAFGLLAVALIVIGSVAWLIARAFSRPIAELQLAVRELASGDTDARVPAAIAERGDELGALAADFNIMARRLEELITTREHLMRDMSHELRSPLARLQAAIALAAERNSLAPETRDRIDQEIGRMNQVIGEMLRYSSLDASANNRLRLVRVDKLLKQLVDVEEIEARNAGCVIELKTDKDVVVAGDPEMLQSCFENILRNAIRHSPADSVIEINARSIGKNKNTNRSSGSVLITISDRGPGVPKEQVDKIFLPYVRINDGNNDVNRTGLGLAIVRRIVEKHAGNVRAANREAGGLIVTVELPAAELI